MGKWRRQEKRVLGAHSVEKWELQGRVPPALVSLVFGGPCTPPHPHSGSETFQKMTAVPLALAQDSGKPSVGAWASEVHGNPDEEVERKLSVTLSEIRIRMLVKHCWLSLAPESMV